MGFTAWSSEREPQDVFLLLQTIYHAFDRLARRRGVFKVETIGDCYVAITGLPDPQPDHAVRMTKFAKECIVRMTEVTKKLEVRLGPDTSELSMRMGVHSGPVTGKSSCRTKNCLICRMSHRSRTHMLQPECYRVKRVGFSYLGTQ